MRALITSQFVIDVDDEHEATEVADEVDQTCRLNLAATLERHDVTEAEAERAGLQWLGTAVAVFE